MINVFGSLMGPEELAEIRTSLEAQWADWKSKWK